MESLNERESPSFVPRPDTCGNRLFSRPFFRRPLYGLLSAFLGFLPGAFPAVFAQPGLRFEHISVDHNLSSDAVYKIIQDRHGFIWIGTEDGLHRFDGYEMVVFRHHPESAGSISHNWVINLYEDSQGRLWATNKEVNILDPAAGLFSQIREHRQDTATLSIHNNIKAVYEDSRGDFWMGGTTRGLLRLNPETGEITTCLHDPNDPHSIRADVGTSLFFDRQGSLWIGGVNGLDRLPGRYVGFPDKPVGQAGFLHQYVLPQATVRANQRMIRAFLF